MSDDLVRTIVDGTHTRRNVRAVIATLEDCGVRGVPVSEALARALPRVMVELMNSDSPRVKSAGVKLALAAMKLNLDIHQHADKVLRLDSGEATERHELKLYGRDAPVDHV